MLKTSSKCLYNVNGDHYFHNASNKSLKDVLNIFSSICLSRCILFPSLFSLLFLYLIIYNRLFVVEKNCMWTKILLNALYGVNCENPNAEWKNIKVLFSHFAYSNLSCDHSFMMNSTMLPLKILTRHWKSYYFPFWWNYQFFSNNLFYMKFCKLFSFIYILLHIIYKITY